MIINCLQTTKINWRIPAVVLILAVICLSLPAQQIYPAFPAKNVTAVRVGKYSPTDLLKNKNGKIITTAQEWRQSRLPEILNDAQQLLYGVPAPDRVLPGVRFNVTTSNGGEGGDKAYIDSGIGYRFPDGGHTNAPD